MPVLYHSTHVLSYRQQENQENWAQPLSILQGRQKHYLNTNALPQTNEINSKVQVPLMVAVKYTNKISVVILSFQKEKWSIVSSVCILYFLFFHVEMLQWTSLNIKEKAEKILLTIHSTIIHIQDRRSKLRM